MARFLVWSTRMRFLLDIVHATVLPTKPDLSPTALLTPSLYIAFTAAGTIALISGLICLAFAPRDGNSHVFGVRVGGQKLALLVTAHPDDESLFLFSAAVPLQRAPSRRTRGGYYDVHEHLICFCTGNFRCRGRVRGRELRHCCHCALGVKPRTHLRIVNHLSLQDGPGANWKVASAARCIEQYVCDTIALRRLPLACGFAHKSESGWQVISFDHGGVSGHPNHSAAHDAAALYNCLNTCFHCNAARCRGPVVDVYEVNSALAFQIFAGMVVLAHRVLRNYLFCAQAAYTATNCARTCMQGNFITGTLAMAAHNSQWVWYRKLHALATASAPLLCTRAC